MTRPSPSPSPPSSPKAEAHRQTLIDAVHREITWRLGPGEDLQITIRNRQISIEPAPNPAP